MILFKYPTSFFIKVENLLRKYFIDENLFHIRGYFCYIEYGKLEVLSIAVLNINNLNKPVLSTNKSIMDFLK